MDMRSLRAFMREAVVTLRSRNPGPDPHGLHSEFMRYFEVAGDILEHGGTHRVDAACIEKALIGALARLRLVLRRHDIENAVKDMIDAQPPDVILRVSERAGREDKISRIMSSR